MTATVAPKPSPSQSLHRVDPAIRLQDYLAGLDFWMKLPDPRIGGVVFAENSGYPLDELKAHVEAIGYPNRVCEFISCDFPPPPKGLHYGYSEFVLVDYVLNNSVLLSQFPYFIKATGRYRYPAISKLLNQLPKDFRVAGDCRIQSPLSKIPNPIFTVAMVLFLTEYYRKELLGLSQRMVPAPPWNRQQFIEDMLYDALYPLRDQVGIILRFPCNCDPVGIGAGHGDDYRALNKFLKGAFRAILRRIAPSVWW